MRCSAILFLVAATLLGGAAAGEPASRFGPPGKLVYSGVLEGGGRGLFAAAADGSNPTRITSGPKDISPRWSPDGRRIVFVRSPAPDATAIWIVNANGTGLRPLDEEHRYAEHPRWSPNGHWVAYQVQTETDQSDLRADTTYELWLVRPDGSERRRLVQGSSAAQGGNPLYSVASGTWVWSPGGRRIAFVSGGEGAERVRVVDVATGNTRLRGPAWDADWSPDGERLAVTVDARLGISPACGTVWIVPRERGKRRVLTRPPSRSSGPQAPCDLWPRWSKDGRSVVFTRSVLEPTRPGRLFVARVGGARVQRVFPLRLDRYRWPASCRRISEYASGYSKGWIVRPSPRAAPRFVHFPRGARPRCNVDSGEPCESAGDWHCS